VTLDGQLLDLLEGHELERVSAGAYLVTLRGRRRRSSLVWLMGGEQDVTVELFVMHVLEGADVAALYRLLLLRNLSLRGVHFGTDEIGDVFLTGSLSRADVTPEGVDRLLGEIWQLLEDIHERLLTTAYGPDVPAKALLDGAGRRPAGTPSSAPHRDARR
jgi:hypothetical protein